MKFINRLNTVSKFAAQFGQPKNTEFRACPSPTSRPHHRAGESAATPRQWPAFFLRALRLRPTGLQPNRAAPVPKPIYDPNSLGLGGEDVLAFRASECLRYSEFLCDEEIAEKHGRTADEIAALKAQALEARAA